MPYCRAAIGDALISLEVLPPLRYYILGIFYYLYSSMYDIQIFSLCSCIPRVPTYIAYYYFLFTFSYIITHKDIEAHRANACKRNYGTQLHEPMHEA